MPHLATSPYPVAWTNPVIMRVSAALLAANAWDVTPVVQNIYGAQGLTLTFTYTEAVAGGAFDYQVQLSPYSIAALVPGGAEEWGMEAIYQAGAVVAGADTQSRYQREYETYNPVGVGAESFPIDFELQAPYERIRIACRESLVDNPAGAPGTLAITMVVW